MIKEFSVKLVGISPLLLHRNSPELEEMLKKCRNNQAKQEIEEKNYELYLYRDENGKPYIPSIMLTRSFVEAAKNFYEEGRGKKTYKNIFGGGLVFIKEDKIPLKTKTGWKPFKTYVRVQRNRVLRVRPQIDDWSLEFTLCVDESVSPQVVKQVIEYAGVYCGLGDFRPQCSGPYGRFKVEEFKAVSRGDG